jgi:hypothetical protein
MLEARKSARPERKNYQRYLANTGKGFEERQRAKVKQPGSVVQVIF